MLKKIIFTIVIVWSCVQLNALPFRIDTIIRQMSNGKEQLIHFVSDAHIEDGLFKLNEAETRSNGKACINQWIDIIKSRGSVKIIIESFYVNPAEINETSALGRAKKAFLKYEQKRNYFPFLCGLAEQCYKENIPYVNVEFRQIAFMPPVLSAYDYVGAMRLDQLAKFNDSPAFNKYYKKMLNYQLSMWKPFMSVSEAAYQQRKKEILDGLEEEMQQKVIAEGIDPVMLCFHSMDSGSSRWLLDVLLETFAVHSIYTAQEDEVFVFMGGDHLDPAREAEKLDPDSADARYKLREPRPFIESVAQVVCKNSAEIKPFSTGISLKESVNLSSQKKFTSILPVDVISHFNQLADLLSQTEKKKQAMVAFGKPELQIKKYLLPALGIAVTAALVWYNWSGISSFFKGIISSPAINSAHTRLHQTA